MSIEKEKKIKKIMSVSIKGIVTTSHGGLISDLHKGSIADMRASLEGKSFLLELVSIIKDRSGTYSTFPNFKFCLPT